MSALGLAALVVLVLINAFFVAAEYSLVTIRRTRVSQLVAEGHPGANHLDDAVRRLDSYIAACQLGITMAGLGLGWLGEPALAGLLEPVFGRLGGPVLGSVMAFVLITVALIIAGELSPKGVALQYTERVALVVAAPLRLFRAIFRPAIWFLNEGGRVFLGLFGVHREVSEHAAQIDPDELRVLVRSSGEAGAIAEQQQYLLERVLRFGNLTVGAVMIPRTEVIAIASTANAGEARQIVAEHHFSRYPVYRKDLDDVLGILHARDLLEARGEVSVVSLLRPTFHVPTQASVNELLTVMRARRTHIAVAVDEYGGTDGIVTLEDVLEEIVGELQDEFERPERHPVRRPGGQVQLDGLDPVDTLTDTLGIELEPGPYNTVAGFVLHLAGDIPEAGATFESHGYRFRVVDMDHLRIATIEVTPIPDHGGDGGALPEHTATS